MSNIFFNLTEVVVEIQVYLDVEGHFEGRKRAYEAEPVYPGLAFLSFTDRQTDIQTLVYN